MAQEQPNECDVCKGAPFERNNYFPGKVLSALDLSAEQQYFNRKRWLINRTVLGWGIVCGLDVSLDNGCLSVHPGLALDCCGRELLLCASDCERKSAGDLAKALHVGPDDDCKDIWWVLCLEYHDRRIDPVKISSSCSEEGSEREYNRVRDDCRVVVRLWSDVCDVVDRSDDCCPYKGLGRKSPIHKSVEAKARNCPHCEGCECVVLAIGTLNQHPKQDPHIVLYPDSWKYRKLVYTNGALAALVRCFHGGLPHIESMNWKPGEHYDVDAFLDRLRQEHLKVTFDQPMNEASVKNVQSCRLSIFLPAEEMGCPVPFLIPIERIDYERIEDDKKSVATYYFDDACIANKLRASCNRLGRAAEVELVLHGSMIENTHAHALDAEFIHDFPTGNGVQGGEFIAYFAVGP